MRDLDSSAQLEPETHKEPIKFSRAPQRINLKQIWTIAEIDAGQVQKNQSASAREPSNLQALPIGLTIGSQNYQTPYFYSLRVSA
jgi:hypothetical protein